MAMRTGMIREETETMVAGQYDYAPSSLVST